LTLFNRVPILQIPQTPNGQVAQLVERGPEKAGVGGSIPSLATINFNNQRLPKKGSSEVSIQISKHRALPSKLLVATLNGAAIQER
jgi:hypothetical protein